MAKMEFIHRTDKPVEEISNWLDAHLERILREKIPSEEVSIEPVKDQNRFLLRGKRISGDIAVTDGRILANIQIPLYLSPFKSKIESEVRNAIKDV